MRLIEKYDKIISKYSNIYPILNKVDLRLAHDCNGNCLIDSFCANHGAIYKYSNNNSTCFEPEIAALMLSRTDGKFYFFDIGANIGFYSLALSNSVNQVHSFEPGIFQHASLATNLEINSVKNVSIHNFALGSFDNANNNFEGSTVWSGSQNSTFNTKNFDNWCKKNIEPNKSSLIKIDVDGFESFVLEGMQSFIKDNCEIMLEFRPSRVDQLGGNSKLVEQIIYDSGFSIFEIRNNDNVKSSEKNLTELPIAINNNVIGRLIPKKNFSESSYKKGANYFLTKNKIDQINISNKFIEWKSLYPKKNKCFPFSILIFDKYNSFPKPSNKELFSLANSLKSLPSSYLEIFNYFIESGDEVNANKALLKAASVTTSPITSIEALKKLSMNGFDIDGEVLNKSVNEMDNFSLVFGDGQKKKEVMLYSYLDAFKLSIKINDFKLIKILFKKLISFKNLENLNLEIAVICSANSKLIFETKAFLEKFLNELNQEYKNVKNLGIALKLVKKHKYFYLLDEIYKILKVQMLRNDITIKELIYIIKIYPLLAFNINFYVFLNIVKRSIKRLISKYF